jgi:hypothetical protein
VVTSSCPPIVNYAWGFITSLAQPYARESWNVSGLGLSFLRNAVKRPVTSSYPVARTHQSLFPRCVGTAFNFSIFMCFLQYCSSISHIANSCAPNIPHSAEAIPVTVFVRLHCLSPNNPRFSETSVPNHPFVISLIDLSQRYVVVSHCM